MTSAIHAADPAVPFVRIDALDVRMTEHLRGIREGAWFGLFLGLLALTLAGAGLHSLLSYIIRRRTREIGIRLTMGARTPDVVWLFLRPALTLLLAGAACGVSMAIVIARVMRAALPGVSTLDGASLLTTAAILSVVAVLATSAPAYRASRVDPVEALRSE